MPKNDDQYTPLDLDLVGKMDPSVRSDFAMKLANAFAELRAKQDPPDPEIEKATANLEDLYES